ncbi:glycogen synthase GlgA [Agrobacterium vaccinii]|jgi:starch synthase|uniref:glycogen synthase GlgA n=1 Tax=Agrobacterium vaccinii TaxID=2735528 RepID=UPI001E30AFA8|nr:glycogen synthase GlgA [Agrobacterium vaccinii]UHS57475.1 glycogen synthase GlgA [Agrobacterium vaccinii]UHS62249.1 glycogen synthase GlgA [Agrobacterium vaccinii]
MNVLSVASEVYPLIKTGGLADVAGALPIALKAYGVTTRTLVPGYPAVKAAVSDAVKIAEFTDLLGESADLLEAHHEGLDLLILDAPAYFDRPAGPYLDSTGKDFEDNWKRFAALSLAAAQIAQGKLADWQPDLLHAHDWQAAMAPVYMRYAETPEIPSVLTIHNIAFQGQFGANIFSQLGLPAHAFNTESIEYYNDISFLKGGVQTSTAISTVSPSYAEEILTPEFGMGLDGVIRSRAHVMHGIVNGIDAEVWNPATDHLINDNYSAANLKLRARNKVSVANHFRIDQGDGPLFCVVSRLTWQKGIDLVTEVVDDIVAMGGRLVVLGAGEIALEGALLAAASRHPGRVGVAIGYNEPLSHLMQAGCDAIIIPSRFEPCGLTQLYALRYGCIPVVARNGGLNDTVIDANHAAVAAKVATGVQFTSITPEGLRQAIRRTVRYYHDQKLWTQMQKQGMKSDVSWEKSAGLYAALYAQLISKGQ